MPVTSCPERVTDLYFPPTPSAMKVEKGISCSLLVFGIWMMATYTSTTIPTQTSMLLTAEFKMSLLKAFHKSPTDSAAFQFNPPGEAGPMTARSLNDISGISRADQHRVP